MASNGIASKIKSVFLLSSMVRFPHIYIYCSQNMFFHVMLCVCFAFEVWVYINWTLYFRWSLIHIRYKVDAQLYTGLYYWTNVLVLVSIKGLRKCTMIVEKMCLLLLVSLCYLKREVQVVICIDKFYIFGIVKKNNFNLVVFDNVEFYDNRRQVQKCIRIDNSYILSIKE